MNFQEPIGGLIERMARALERLAPLPPRKPDFNAEAFIWQAEPEAFSAVGNVNRVPLSLLKGIDRMRDVLYHNTVRFARGLPANNALLWGARGTGKSSLVKAVHAAVSRETKPQEGGRTGGILCREMSWMAEIQATLGCRLTVGNERRLMRWFRSQTALACGLASTHSVKILTSKWCAVMLSITACTSPMMTFGARRLNGPSPVARALAAWRFNTFRIWLAAWVCGSTRLRLFTIYAPASPWAFGFGRRS
jgi:hypothetical protein